MADLFIVQQTAAAHRHFYQVALAGNQGRVALIFQRPYHQFFINRLAAAQFGHHIRHCGAHGQYHQVLEAAGHFQD